MAIMIETRVALGKATDDGGIFFLERTSRLPGKWDYFYRYRELFGTLSSIPWKHDIPWEEFPRTSSLPWYRENDPDFHQCRTNPLCTMANGPTLWEVGMELYKLGKSVYSFATGVLALKEIEGFGEFLKFAYGLATGSTDASAAFSKLSANWEQSDYVPVYEFVVSYPNPAYDFVLVEMHGKSEEINNDDFTDWPEATFGSADKLEPAIFLPRFAESPFSRKLSDPRRGVVVGDGLERLDEQPDEPITMLYEPHDTRPKVSWLVDLRKLREASGSPAGFFQTLPFSFGIKEQAAETILPPLKLQQVLLLNIKPQQQPAIRSFIDVTYFEKAGDVRTEVGRHRIWEGVETAADLSQPYLDGTMLQRLLLEVGTDGRYRYGGRTYDEIRVEFVVDSERVFGASAGFLRAEVAQVNDSISARTQHIFGAPRPEKVYRPIDHHELPKLKYSSEGRVSALYELDIRGLPAGTSDQLLFSVTYTGSNFSSGFIGLEIRSREFCDHEVPDTRVRVPTLIGYTRDRAIDSLRFSGLEANPSVVFIRGSQQLDRVRSQDPREGSLVEPGTVVSFEYTFPGVLPEGNALVPEIVGLEVAEALTSVEAVGFVGRREGAAFLVLGRTYRVVRQDPAPAELAQRGSTIRYWLDDGAASEEPTLVPDVVGHSVEKARKLLVEHRLNSKGPIMTPTATVRAQDPTPGTRVKRRSVVILQAQ